MSDDIRTIVFVLNSLTFNLKASLGPNLRQLTACHRKFPKTNETSRIAMADGKLQTGEAAILLYGVLVGQNNNSFLTLISFVS